MAIRYLQIRQAFARNFSSKTTNNKTIPVIWDYRTSSDADSPREAVTVQLLSWGRGASGQLGSGTEETRIYPAPVGSLLLPPSFTLSSPIPGRLPSSTSRNEDEGSVKVGISCGLFHSGLLVNRQLYIWGKGDGGRLGLGHEDSVFVPTLNTYLASNEVKSIALGGLHSIALDSLGQVFSWSVCTLFLFCFSFHCLTFSFGVLMEDSIDLFLPFLEYLYDIHSKGTFWASLSMLNQWILGF